VLFPSPPDRRRQRAAIGARHPDRSLLLTRKLTPRASTPAASNSTSAATNTSLIVSPRTDASSPTLRSVSRSSARCTAVVCRPSTRSRTGVARAVVRAKPTPPAVRAPRRTRVRQRAPRVTRTSQRTRSTSRGSRCRDPAHRLHPATTLKELLDRTRVEVVLDSGLHHARSRSRRLKGPFAARLETANRRSSPGINRPLRSRPSRRTAASAASGPPGRSLPPTPASSPRGAARSHPQPDGGANSTAHATIRHTTNSK